MEGQTPTLETAEGTLPTAEAKEQNPIKAEAPKVSPAQDLRNVQMLIVSGIYPGNIAPQVISAYQLLEKMAQKVEADAGYKA